jgi:predicted nucleotidyltransferase
MQPFLEEKREQIAELCRTHHVRRLAVFGSAVRDDFDPARSDIDFLVEFEPIDDMRYYDNKNELVDGLQDITGRRIDLIVRKWINNPYFLSAVESEQQELYAA